MSVFGQQSTTNTEMATGLGQSDYSLTTNYNGSAPLNISPPPPPSSPFSITSDSWLPGTTGVDCKLVHGDRWQEIEGNMTQHVAQNKTSTYDGNFGETYKGNVDRVMWGQTFTETYHTLDDLCSRDYNGHATETFHAGHTQINKHEELETRSSKAEAIQEFSLELNWRKFEFLGLATTCSLGEVSAAVAGTCFRGAELILAGSKFEFGVYKKEGFAYGDEIKALKNEIHAMKIGVNKLRFHLIELGIYTGPIWGPNQLD